MPTNTIIVWFRQDLRLADNPALTAAIKTGAKILPVYVLDDINAGAWKMGGASRWWLHHSLQSLNADLDGNLVLMKGDALVQIASLAQEIKASAVYWNRCYEPWRVKRDKLVKQSLKDIGVDCESFNGSLLWEPWQVLKDDGTPYKVFTPFYRRGYLSKQEPRQPLPRPKDIALASYKGGLKICDLALLPQKPEPRWDKKIEQYWEIGESGAHKAFKHFLACGLENYKEGRNFMAADNISRMSSRLHFGEVSPNQLWHAVRKSKAPEKDIDNFCSELGWREFSYGLLYHFPDLPSKNLQPRFDAFPWLKSDKNLNAWQRGQTGYPIVDAAMRELWKTGYMHNRARMVVGSFLVKHLLLDWRAGEEWFWECLVDADLANNAASWQWIAGSGADAAPYFRIFNPVLQGEKFDPDGAYVKRFVPELAALPDKYIHKPWDAPANVMQAAKVTLGTTYPKPIVEHTEAREAALTAFGKTKE